MCLQVIIDAWPDVSSLLKFEMTNSTTFPHCKIVNLSNQEYLFYEIPVPPMNRDFISFIEGYFNNGTQVESRCYLCTQYSVTLNKTTLTTVSRTNFIVIVLSREEQSHQGEVLNMNNVTAIGEITIR